ncbi:MAG: BadF/BadG/BcrA/BcrD ATPase family protein [Rhabdochlamydiaceae bacterium]|jgi:N-acetylglucosamine kinase-like BadF-type ATPase
MSSNVALEKGLTFCFDGGGSKLALQVIDDQGRIISLTKDGKEFQSVESGPSNINVVQKEGVRTSLHDLFKGLKIGSDQRDCREVLPGSRVVAGMAGVGISENLALVTSLFEELGAQHEKLLLLTDAELALRLLKGTGVVLISGTGSICFAEKAGSRQRVGGLGPVLGDEGSGYQIGLQAIKAGLAEEFRYGPATSMTPALKAFFQVDELKTLFPQINSHKMSPATIAGASPLVFENAAKQDPVSVKIISRAADDLCELVRVALTITQLTHCELHLWGGVFKGAHAEEAIVEKIKSETAHLGITIVNQSSENAAVIFARTFGSTL